MNRFTATHIEPALPQVQSFSQVVSLRIALDRQVRQESIINLNQLLADTITVRDLYKKHHWQVSGPMFYQLHLLYDQHFEQQNDIVDLIGERIMMLGGLGVAMSADATEMTLIPRPPRDREDPKAQITRLQHAHEIVLQEARTIAHLASTNGDDGTNDLVVSSVIRTNERQAWFIGEHLAVISDLQRPNNSHG